MANVSRPVELYNPVYPVKKTTETEKPKKKPPPPPKKPKKKKKSETKKIKNANRKKLLPWM